jgi:ABC-type glutathione transport system ATPase component
MQRIRAENVDITIIQETYVYQNRIKGFTRDYRTYASGDDKIRAAIIYQMTIDAITITQCSDNDTVLVEIRMGRETFYAASIYMEYNNAIENSFKKIEITCGGIVGESGSSRTGLQRIIQSANS